jgi:recombination protein RecA
MDIKEIATLANKTLGENSFMLLDSTDDIKTEVISTGIDCIDEVFGGGVPKGRVTEIFGREASGKSTLCLHLIKSAQDMGLKTAFIDIEQAVSKDRMDAIGVSPGNLLFAQPNSAEEAFDLIEYCSSSREVGLVVVDSIAHLVPQSEIDKDFGDAPMASQARLMSQAMRKLVPSIARSGLALVFTNQLRANIGSFGFGNKDVTSGGSAVRYAASLRVKMSYVGQIKDGSGQRVSGKYTAEVIKNKFATPFRKAEFEINEYGIDTLGDLIEKYLKSGILTASGAFYKLDGEVVAQGARALKEKLREGGLKITLDSLLKTE